MYSVSCVINYMYFHINYIRTTYTIRHYIYMFIYHMYMSYADINV